MAVMEAAAVVACTADLNRFITRVTHRGREALPPEQGAAVPPISVVLSSIIAIWMLPANQKNSSNCFVSFL